MMKKLIFTFLLCASGFSLTSCNDEFNDEFIELSTEDPKPAGGGTGGGVSDPDEPE